MQLRLTYSFAGALAACGLLTVAALLTSTAAEAQQQPAAKSLEEVTVTARRREESLQEVPIAVSAYSGEFLDEIGALDITALTQTTPNTTLEVSRATNTTLTAYIRGVGQQDPLAGFEGGVGIYLDDVYLARPQGTVFDIYDVERVEILRGPQGTLYGRNTIGGAVRYVTRRLAEDPELSVKASYGTYNQADLVLKGSTPVSDSLRLGGTVATFNRDGFGDNLFTGQDNADKEVLAFRGSAEWQPGDDWFVRLSADYTDDDSSPRHGHRLLPSTAGDPVLNDVFDTRAGITTIPTSNAGLKQNVKQYGVGLQAEWSVSDSLLLKSITSYREDESDSLIDFDNLPPDTFDAPVIYDNRQFSQEFQASYTSDDVSGVFGVYFLESNAFDAFDVLIFSAITSFTLGDYDTSAWAAFADFTWDVTDSVSLSAGARYTEDERRATVIRESFAGLGSPYFGNAGAVSTTVPVPGFVPTFKGQRTDSDFTPRVSVNWAPVDEHNFYVSYSEGFKGGGFDPRGAYQFPEVQAGFEPETVESVELGAKSIWADGRFQTNVAAFFSDYTNVQVPGSIILDNDGDGVADGFAGTTTNAGKAEIKGLEIEAVATFTEAFSSTLAIGYIDAEYTEWLVASTDAMTGAPIFVDVSNERKFQNTPEWSGNLSLRYEWPLSAFQNAGSLALSGSLSYKDDTFQFEIPDPLVDQDAYTLVDLNLVWNSDDGRYSLGLHGRNLTDEEYIVANYNFPTVNNSVIGFYGNPLTVSLTGTVNFR